MGSVSGSPSFIAAVAAVQIFALQFPTGVVDAGDFIAEAVHAPANTPFPTTRRLTLQVRRGPNVMITK